MTQPFRLQSLKNLAQNHSDQATIALGKLNKQQQGARQKLALLLDYRKDYHAQLQDLTTQGIDPASLRNFQQFIIRLDEAIIQQTAAVEQSRIEVQFGLSSFRKSMQKLKSFDLLYQRHLDQENQVALKSEQKVLDEHTGRMSAAKMLNTESD